MAKSRPSHGLPQTSVAALQSGASLGPFDGIPDARVRVLFEPPSRLIVEAELGEKPDKLFVADIADWASWLESNPAAIWRALDVAMSGRKRPAELTLILRLVVPQLDTVTENRIKALRYPVEVICSKPPHSSAPTKTTRSSSQLFNWPGRDDGARPCVIRRKPTASGPTSGPHIDPRIDALWASLCEAVNARNLQPSRGHYDWHHDPDITGIRAYALLVTLGMNLMVIQATQTTGGGKLTKRVAERVDAMSKVVLWILRECISTCVAGQRSSHKEIICPRISEAAAARVAEHSASVAVAPAVLPECWAEPLPSSFETLLAEMAYPAASAFGQVVAAQEVSKLPARDTELLVQANFGVAAAVEIGVASNHGALPRPRNINDRAFQRAALIRVACAHRILLELFGVPAPNRNFTLGMLSLVAAIARVAMTYAMSLRGASVQLLADRMKKSVSSLSSTGTLGSQGKTAKGVAKAREVERSLLQLLEKLV